MQTATNGSAFLPWSLIWTGCQRATETHTHARIDTLTDEHTEDFIR